MRRTSHLSASRREAMLRELERLRELEAQATMDKMVHVAMCVAEGMTLREIAPIFDVSATAVGNWKVKGERERERLRRPKAADD